MREMREIKTAQFAVLYLFDVAEAIDLARVEAATGTRTATAMLRPKPATPAYVQYTQPPLVMDGDALGMPAIDQFRVRIKVFDYGVISLALMRDFAGSWIELIAGAQQFIEDERLERQAEEYTRRLVDRLRPAATSPREHFLSEDYVIVIVNELDEPLPGDALVATRGDELTLLLRGERQALSRQEKEEVLRHRLSYLADDLVIPTWNAAFVYDTPAGSQAAMEIIEFANSQLLQYRYYDDLLDAELARIYADLQAPRWYDALFGRRYTRAAQQLHALFIDVNELTDRTENALKIAGDVYAARLFTLVAARLGVDRWKANVQEKLKTLDDIYRFSVEQTGMARGQFLELVVVIILLLELVLFIGGIMR
jgi:hypothetical protein